MFWRVADEVCSEVPPALMDMLYEAIESWFAARPDCRRRVVFPLCYLMFRLCYLLFPFVGPFFF